METWTQQTGFPLITIKRDGNVITASQKRFLVSPHENETELLEPKSPFGYKWYVPLNYYTDKDSMNVTNIWMNMTNGKMEIIYFYLDNKYTLVSFVNRKKSFEKDNIYYSFLY